MDNIGNFDKKEITNRLIEETKASINKLIDLINKDINIEDDEFKNPLDRITNVTKLAEQKSKTFDVVETLSKKCEKLSKEVTQEEKDEEDLKHLSFVEEYIEHGTIAT